MISIDTNEKVNKPIRVLHCVAGLTRGGYETFIMNVYRNIDTSKVQFDFLYSFDGVFNDEILSLGGRIYKIPFITQSGPFKYKKAVCNFFANHTEYKIVHSHMDKFSGLIMKCAKKFGVPTRIAHSHSTQNEGGVLFNIVKNYYGKMIHSNCTDRFACSENAAKWLFGDKYVNCKIIKNGIQTQLYKYNDIKNKQEFTIINVARFSKTKNHKFLLEIFYELQKIEPSSRLVLAGTGETQKQMIEKSKALKIDDKVLFFGDCDDVPSLLAQADVFCMPSFFEGLGISLVEAQAAGLKCIASDKIPHEVNITGNVKFISLNCTAQAWAQEILKLKGYKKVDTHEAIIKKGFDIKSTTKQLECFYIDRGSN